MEQADAIDKTAIRDAATVIVLRDRKDNPRVLMGQRGAKAAFMPNKIVFPGGAVDQGDGFIPLAAPLNTLCQGRLQEDCSTDISHALAVAAIRELWEETGLILGQRGEWTVLPPEAWTSFAQAGFVLDASSLQFVFRAITPPGRPRRFDARFFLIDADQLSSDLDDFSRASEELSHLQWVPISQARNFDLPFITEVVLGEITERLRTPDTRRPAPFFHHDGGRSYLTGL